MLCICHMACTKKLIGQSDFQKKKLSNPKYEEFLLNH